MNHMAPQQQRLIGILCVSRCPTKWTSTTENVYMCMCVYIYMDMYVLCTFNLGRNG